jgi:hypothetical protein
MPRLSSLIAYSTHTKQSKDVLEMEFRYSKSFEIMAKWNWLRCSSTPILIHVARLTFLETMNPAFRSVRATKSKKN